MYTVNVIFAFCDQLLSQSGPDVINGPTVIHGSLLDFNCARALLGQIGYFELCRSTVLVGVLIDGVGVLIGGVGVLITGVGCPPIVSNDVHNKHSKLHKIS